MSFFSSTLQRILYKDLHPPVRNLWLKQVRTTRFSRWTFGNKGRMPKCCDCAQAMYGKTIRVTLWILGHSRDLAPSCPLGQFVLNLIFHSFKDQHTQGESSGGVPRALPRKQLGSICSASFPKYRSRGEAYTSTHFFVCVDDYLEHTLGTLNLFLIASLLDYIDILHWEHGKPEAFLGLWLILFSISAAPGLFWCLDRAF